MLIVFKSKASAEIVMYKKHVQELFTFLNKDVERGVITADETSEIIKKIENYIQEHQKLSEDTDENKDNHEDDMDEQEKYKQLQKVSLSTRLFPLLEMLQVANKQQDDILWGV